MADRADDIQQDIKDTQREIADSRLAMTEKLELLGERVRETAEEAQASVERIVENVRDTVDMTVAAVKQTVEGAQTSAEGMVENVRGTVRETVDAVQRTFDLHHQMEQHPWLMLSGSLFVGYLLGSAWNGRTSASGSASDQRLSSARFIPASPNEPFTRSQPQPRTRSGVLERYKDEIALIEGAAVGTVMNTLLGMLKQALPTVASHLRSNTTQQGGQPSGHLVQTPLAMPSAAINGSAILSIQGRE